MKKTLLLAAVLGLTLSGTAATYQWDTNGTTAGLGGSGTWDTTGTNWDLSGDGADDGTGATVSHTFTASDTAQFGGTGGTVTLNSAISVGTIQFAPTSGNYTFNFQSGANSSTIGNISLTNTTLDTSGAALTAGTINLNSGSLLKFATEGYGAVTATINLAGGKLEFSGGNNAQFNGTFTGSGDLLMDSGASYGNKLTITAASLNNTYTGNTTIVNNVVQFNGYGSGNFNAFGTDTTKTLTLTGKDGAYGPTAGIIFNPSGNTGDTFTIGQRLSLNSSAGVVAYIQNNDGTLRFTGNAAINTDATAGSAVKFITQYSNKDIYLDGVVSGSGTIIVTDLSGNGYYGNGSLRLTNDNNTFSGTIRLTNEGGHSGLLTLDANGAAKNATIEFATPTTPNAESGGRLRVNTANATVAGIHSSDAFATIFNTDAAIRTLTVDAAGDSTFAGRIGVAGTYAWNNYNTTENGANLALVKNGAGTLTLSGQNAYIGTTRVNAGTLAVTGSIIANNSASGVSIASGATLALSGTLKLGGTLAKIANDGTLNLGGVLDLNGAFDNLFGAEGGSYALITGNGTTSGGFTSITGFDRNAWDVAFSNGSLNFTAVPEPSAYGLLGAGALAVAALVRRRRKATQA